MIPFIFFLIPIFTIWAGDTEHLVFQTDDAKVWCYHNHADGCLQEIGGKIVVIVEDPFKKDTRGGTILQHEWYHLMGYEENEIPQVVESQEFRK